MSIDEETGTAGPGFERTPPSNIEAEQSVLGGMLLSKDAIADVVEILRADDFYRPAHQMVYDVITDLYGRGEPADAVTVFDELQKRGEMARVGGAAYLHTLTAVVPTAANAGYYAKIVREQAILRRLIEAGTRIVSFGYGGQNEEVDDLVDRAQAEIYKVTDRRTSEDYSPLSEIMPGALDELEAIGSRSGHMVGVPTGFQDLDSLTNGLHPGQMIVVAARPAMGKALALDTPLPTPTGWTTMGEVAVDGLLLGADGRPTRVVATTGTLLDRPCYEVVFDDGTVIVADAWHEWRLADGSVSTTEVLAKTVTRPSVDGDAAVQGAGTVDGDAAAQGAGTVADRDAAVAVAVAGAFDLPDLELLLDPHTLGTWLGSLPTRAAQDTVADTLRVLGVLGEPRVPPAYLRASARQRRGLLDGLLDAAGDAGRTRIAVSGAKLAEDVHELALSLGHRAVLRVTVPDKDACVVELTAPRAREVVEVRPVPSRPVRCVEVDNADHLYLAGRSCVPTHNSTLGLDFARSAAIKHNMTTVIFSLEMSRNEITMRLLSAEARVSLQSMRSGTMSDDDWTRLARRMSEVAEAPLFIDDSPNMSMMEIRAKCRRLKQRHDLRFVIIDYLQLMSSPKKTESRQNEVSEISRGIKLLAKELEVPVIAMSQLNRGPEQRQDKRPQVSDLRESGCLTARTRVLRADTGAEVSLGELLASGARDIPVWSLDDRLKLVPRTMTHVFPNGTKRVYRVRLRSGREVEATANHPFLTLDGWRPVGDLPVGAKVAVVRHVPPPLDLDPRVEHTVESVFSAPKRQLAAFVAALWRDGTHGDGTHGDSTHGDGAHRDGARHGDGAHWDGERAHVSYTAPDRRTADDVARLLLRLNVFASVEGTRLTVEDTDNQLRFLDETGLAPECARSIRTARLQDPRHDGKLRERLREAMLTPAGARRERIGGLADVLDDEGIELVAANDVFWDEIVAVDPLGEQVVYDATVLGTHNFVADGVAVHNSIEQDADMVILLHREDAYEKESPRAGEADLIVGKHRNGPTATVTVAFQGHYSRFVDMAQH
ncbi:replicative DNA helicase [Nonomuraea longicatena]|uniref:Replicative DNA helicase n=1 Tax=Nonomuraea longicatena TaxID=83682 RepID=A0ABP3Z9J5_9ACTN